MALQLAYSQFTVIIHVAHAPQVIDAGKQQWQ